MAINVVTMTGFVEYARVFPENMDSNPDFHPTGQFNMNFYPETDADLQALWDSGYPETFRGTSRLKTPKDGQAGYGIGQFVKLKRDNVNDIVDTWGGPPSVVHWSGDKIGQPWSMTTDGELGNGTKVRVKMTVYGSGDRTGSRLEKIGVMELVPYTSSTRVDVDGF